MAGRFIVVEGIDGAGKSTLAKALEEHLRVSGNEVVVTYEPQHSGAGALARALFSPCPSSAKTAENWRFMEREMLLAADRMNHIRNCIAPDLMRADVVCDRYVPSGRAYARALAPDGWDDHLDRFLDSMYELAPSPDLIVLVDLAPRLAIERTKSRRDLSAYDSDLHLLERVRADFLRQAHKPFANWLIISGEVSTAGQLEAVVHELNRKKDIPF